MNLVIKNKLAHTWFWLFIGSLTLGQLTRFSFSPSINIYLHDVLILGLLLSVLIFKPSLFLELSVLLKKMVKKHLLIQAILVWSLLGIGLGIVSGSFSIHSSLYLLRLLSYGLALAILKLLTHRDTMQIGLASSGLLIALLGFFQLWLLPDLRFLQYLGWDDHLNRLGSTLFDPGFTGAILVITYFSARLFHPDKTKIMFRTVKILLIAAILLTFSRASYIALSAVLSWDLVAQLKTVRNKFPVLLLGACLLLLAGLFTYQASLNEGEGVKLLRTSSITARLENVRSNVLKQSPLTAIVGSGWFHQQTQSQNSRPIPSHNQVPDNLFVFIFTSTGLVGVLLCGAGLVRGFRYLYFHKPFLTPLLLAIFLHSQFAATLTQPFVFLFLGGTILAWWDEPTCNTQ